MENGGYLRSNFHLVGLGPWAKPLFCNPILIRFRINYPINWLKYSLWWRGKHWMVSSAWRVYQWNASENDEKLIPIMFAAVMKEKRSDKLELFSQWPFNDFTGLLSFLIWLVEMMPFSLDWKIKYSGPMASTQISTYTDLKWLNTLPLIVFTQIKALLHLIGVSFFKKKVLSLFK